MPVTYLIRFDVQPSERSRFLRLLNALLDAMREEPMFHHAALGVDPTDGNRFLLHESWESHEDVLNVQVKRSYRDEWHAALPDLLASPREITMWQPLRAEHAPQSTINAQRVPD